MKRKFYRIVYGKKGNDSEQFDAEHLDRCNMRCISRLSDEPEIFLVTEILKPIPIVKKPVVKYVENFS